MIQEVVQQVEDTVKDVLGSVHTAMPGKVVAVYPETGMIDAQPVGSYHCSGIEMEYPVIPGIPLCISAYVSEEKEIAACFPVHEDDTVLLIFTEQSLSALLTETDEGQSDERFELQNAIAIPGLAKMPVMAQQKANEEDCYLIVNGEDVSIRLSEEEIEIKAPRIIMEAEEGITLSAESVQVTGEMQVSASLSVGGNVSAASGSITGTLTVGTINARNYENLPG